MVRQKTDPAVQLSILDKLIDNAPEKRTESAQQVASVANLRHNVRRDLENLLNAKMQWHTWPECYKELKHSLFSYGLPDFSSMQLSSQDGRDQLCHIIEQTIRKFEPRFVEVAVRVAEEEQPVDRILRLRIDALLSAEPFPEALTFDSEVEPVSLGMRIREA